MRLKIGLSSIEYWFRADVFLMPDTSLKMTKTRKLLLT